MDARTEEEVPEKCLSSLKAKGLVDICEGISTFAFDRCSWLPLLLQFSPRFVKDLIPCLIRHTSAHDDACVSCSSICASNFLIPNKTGQIMRYLNTAIQLFIALSTVKKKMRFNMFISSWVCAQRYWFSWSNSLGRPSLPCQAGDCELSAWTV